jgi:hypothetical protein
VIGIGNGSKGKAEPIQGGRAGGRPLIKRSQPDGRSSSRSPSLDQAWKADRRRSRNWCARALKVSNSFGAGCLAASSPSGMLTIGTWCILLMSLMRIVQ